MITVHVPPDTLYKDDLPTMIDLSKVTIKMPHCHCMLACFTRWVDAKQAPLIKQQQVHNQCLCRATCRRPPSSHNISHISLTTSAAPAPARLHLITTTSTATTATVKITSGRLPTHLLMLQGAFCASSLSIYTSFSAPPSSSSQIATGRPCTSQITSRLPVR